VPIGDALGASLADAGIQALILGIEAKPIVGSALVYDTLHVIDID